MKSGKNVVQQDVVALKNLKTKLIELRIELMQSAGNKVDTSQFRKLRKQIARIKTKESLRKIMELRDE